MSLLGARLQRFVPQRLLCRFVYRIARSRRGWIKTPLIAWFANHYGIDLAEAVVKQRRGYASFNDFFTRALDAAARPIAPDADTLVAPADGTLTEHGRLESDRLLQAKGMTYTIGALTGEPELVLAPFLDGAYATVYLAPHNYHRVHMPFAGRLVRTRYVPGERYSVNAASAAAIEGLFCRNERVICWFEGALGPFAVVLVGALNVSSISTVALGEIASGAAREWPAVPPIELAKGAELGRFNLGSTVVLLLPRGAVEWNATLGNGDTLFMGTAIGRRRTP
jgi:phosphatidylserine decarboxylase